MDKDDFIKITGNGDKYVAVESIHNPINKSTVLPEITSVRNTIWPYVECPIYVPLPSLGANLPSGAVVSNHLQEH